MQLDDSLTSRSWHSVQNGQMFDSRGGPSSGGEEESVDLSPKRLLTEDDVKKFLGGQWPRQDERAEYAEDKAMYSSDEDDETTRPKRRKVEDSLAGFMPGAHFLEVPQDNRPMVIPFFEMVLPPPVTEQMVTCTNQNAEILKLLQSKPYLFADWPALTESEFKVFLGLLFLMEEIRLSKVSDYWRKGRLYRIPIFQGTMPRRRFLGILTALSFNVLVPPPSEAVLRSDKLHKLRPLLDHFNNLVSSLHCPGLPPFEESLAAFGQSPLFADLPWYRRLGIYLLHRLLELACLIYNDQAPGEGLSLARFRQRVVEALLPDGTGIAAPDPPPVVAQIEPGDKPHYMSYIGTNEKGKKRRKRCKYCMDNHNKRKESYFCCAGCPNNPGFCIDGCFAKYHGYS